MNATLDTTAREISTSRLFDAPPETVFRMWTDPEHVKQWWGPRGFTTTTQQMDVRPGGEWIFVMHGPDGRDYKNRIVYNEVDAPRLLTYTHAVEPFFDVRVVFEEEGGKTRVSMVMVFATAEERERVVKVYGAIDGMHQTLDRLEEVLRNEVPFVVSRVFDAPRDLVFRMWTEEEHLRHWWGPKGMTMEHLTNDPRPGGVMHYGMRGPGGHMMWGKWVYREIAPPERLSFVVSFSDERGNATRAPFSGNWPLEVLSTLTFTEVEGGKTLVSMEGVPVNANETERDMFRGFFASMQNGWGGTLDQLAEYLRSV